MQLHPQRRFGLVPVAVVTLALAACASSPPPTVQIAVAEAAVQRAGTTTTAETAAAELRVATDKLAAAHSALSAGNHDRARRLAEQAELDAQVAQLHAQATRSTQVAQETQEAALVLREEIARKTPR